MSGPPAAPPISELGIDQLCINTTRTLSIDAVQQAKSGHPGTPRALAPLVYTIWNRSMRFDPKDPIWPNRDRFVLSNGHASLLLLWSVLHLTKTQAVNAEYESLGQPSVTLDDIRRFRRLDSKAPGHPEYHLVAGVETTTGLLGQGVATSAGIAIAQEWLANRYWVGPKSPHVAADATGIAGREASRKMLDVLAQNIPWFLGGSADRGPSNKTTLAFEGAGDFQSGREEFPFRHPRTRDGSDCKRTLVVGGSMPIRFDLAGVLREESARSAQGAPHVQSHRS